MDFFMSFPPFSLIALLFLAEVYKIIQESKSYQILLHKKSDLMIAF